VNGDIDAGGKITTSVVDTIGNLPMLSITQVVNVNLGKDASFPKFTGRQRQQQC
jgi:hypothetical protein